MYCTITCKLTTNSKLHLFWHLPTDCVLPQHCFLVSFKRAILRLSPVSEWISSVFYSLSLVTLENDAARAILTTVNSQRLLFRGFLFDGDGKL
jgi:hypothetical protein